MTLLGHRQSHHDRRRLTALRVAGLVDSAGLALGWTVFTLYAADNQGLTAVGVYHAAMYVGVALSSRFTAWLTRRTDGQAALRALSTGEAFLRIAGFLMLLANVPPWVVAFVVLVQNVVAWSGYALMRAEVAAVDAGSANLTWFGVCIGGAEAVAAAIATFLPTAASHIPTLGIVAVSIAYAGCLLPTWKVAGHARTQPSKAVGRRGGQRAVPLGQLSAGVLITLLAAGPTLLAVPLSDRMAGHAGVVVALLAFTTGTLLAPRLAGLVDRLSPRHAWPLLGLGMAAGWCLAPLHIVGLAIAQAMSGAASTAFEGSMDARLHARDVSNPSLLAGGASARALGGAAAVMLLPLLLEDISIVGISLTVCVVLCASTLMPMRGSALGQTIRRIQPTAATPRMESRIAA